MTDIYFSFDTEDFTSDLSSDAVRDEAKLLTAYGFKGNFNIVGFLAREFVRARRWDVLDALKKHTISFHSLGHTYHPTICEYTDTEDYAAAREELERREWQGMGMVKAACGVDSFAAACPPGDSLSYVAMYAYADAGIPLYVGSVFRTDNGRNVYFCNGLHTNYDVTMEWLFLDRDDFDEKKFLDSIADKKQVVIYNHPNRVYYSEFWDKYNYAGVNMHPMHEWVEPPRYTPAQTARYFSCMSRLLEALRKDDRFRICDMDDLKNKALSDIYGRCVMREWLPEICRQLKSCLRWISSPVSLSVADCFYAAQSFLLHPEADRYAPGKVHGFLYEPQGTKETVSLTKGEVIRLAAAVSPDRFLPPYFECDGKRIGPADLLFAMLDATMGKEIITIEPKAQQCRYCDAYPELRDIRLKGTWLHADTFEDKFLSDRLRLQAWTIREEE